MGKSSNLKAAIAAQEALNANRSRTEDAAYRKANAEAQKAYDRLSIAEKARFHVSGA